MLSHPLSVIALVSFYLTNKLMDHRPLSNRRSFPFHSYERKEYKVLAQISSGYSFVRGRLPMCYSPVCHSPPKWIVRLACLRHAASVHPEPGSNSHENVMIYVLKKAHHSFKI